MRSICPVCGGGDLEVFLTRRNVPVHQNLLLRTAAAAKSIARGDLVMTVCRRCEFIFNAAFDASKLQYGPDYENDQTCSPSFDQHVAELVRMLVDEKGVRDTMVVEVGCGNGDFLRRLISSPNSGNRGVGFDPSYRGPLSDLDGRVSYRQRFYGPDAGVVPDVVVSRHVIEHMAEPQALVDPVRAATAGRPVRLFLETPCVEWILRNVAIWDFFYEHCSLFTARSLAGLVRRSGFAVQSVSHVFGGQYLWLEADDGSVDSQVNGAHDLTAEARAFGAKEQKEKERWRERVRALAKQGPVAIWGAGAKGVTFAGLVDPDATAVECLIDINPRKQGRCVPVTAHPIVSLREAAGRGVARAVLMNRNYYQETVAMIDDAGVDIELIV